MIPSKPVTVSAISGDEEAEMERLTAPTDDKEEKSEGMFEHIDEFIRGLNHEELEYVMNCARDALGEEGKLDKEVDVPAEPEESGATTNVQ